MGIAIGTGSARLYIGGSPVARAYLGATQANFTIPRDTVFLDIPDSLTRLRLIAHFCGGMVS